MKKESSKIAVIGSGIAGITAAYLLQKEHDITIFEQNSYVGGHTNTVTIQTGEDAGLPVDTGFIVFNERTYPNLLKFFAKLGVEYGNTDMSFSYYDPSRNINYNTNGLGGIFFDKKNIFNYKYWRFLFALFKYGKIFEEALLAGELKGLTLGEFFSSTKLADEILEWLIIPMAAAIWSSSSDDMRNFPAETFTRFYYNHGLLTLFKQPQWYYVKGGSSSYVKKFLASFKGQVELNKGVDTIERSDNSCRLKFRDGSSESFDYAVVASHADQAFHMLEAPTKAEQKLLGSWIYSKNRTVLHTDTTHLPPEKGVWASWNYLPTKSGTSNVHVSYWMNNLQNLATKNDYLVSLNTSRPIAKEKQIAEFMYEHPVFSFDLLKTQGELHSLNGNGRCFFCGSYFGYGFHEDACLSAVNVAKHFGCEL